MTQTCHSPTLIIRVVVIQNYAVNSIMVRVSAWPTVEWLSSNSLTPSRTPESLSAVPGRGGIGSSLADWLSSWSRAGTLVRQDVWIRTPNGEEHVDLTVEYRGRRIGVRITARYERETQERDAIVLVYGRFDALYRIRPRSDTSAATDAAYLLMGMHPSWFTRSGRMEAGRHASEEAVLKARTFSELGMTTVGTMHVVRIRLSRANDWVLKFENALGRPPLSRNSQRSKTRRSGTSMEEIHPRGPSESEDRL
jgi:hypothetical protein